MGMENFISKVKETFSSGPEVLQRPLTAGETIPDKIFKTARLRQEKTEKAHADISAANTRMNDLTVKFAELKKQFEEKSKTKKLTAFDAGEGKTIFYALSTVKTSMENEMGNANDSKKIGDDNLTTVRSQYEPYLGGQGGENLRPVLDQIAGRSTEIQQVFGDISSKNKSTEIQRIIDALYQA